MSDWIYNKNIDLSKYFGFIYKITLPNGRYYIGQKQIVLDNKRIIGKRELEQKGKSAFRKYKSKRGKNKGKWVYYEEASKEDWKDYYGSSKATDIHDYISREGSDKIKREILGFAKTKRDLTFWELFYLVKNNVLFDEKSLNQNILGKYFQDKIGKLEK